MVNNFMKNVTPSNYDCSFFYVMWNEHRHYKKKYQNQQRNSSNNSQKPQSILQIFKHKAPTIKVIQKVNNNLFYNQFGCFGTPLRFTPRCKVSASNHKNLVHLQCCLFRNWWPLLNFTALQMVHPTYR